MKNRCFYSVYDKVADEFGPVFEAVNDAVAKRMCYNLLDTPGVSASPSDFSLYFIGILSNELDVSKEGMSTFDSSALRFVASLDKLVKEPKDGI